MKMNKTALLTLCLALLTACDSGPKHYYVVVSRADGTKCFDPPVACWADGGCMKCGSNDGPGYYVACGDVALIVSEGRCPRLPADVTAEEIRK
jgi:hypothetical protein